MRVAASATPEEENELATNTVEEKVVEETKAQERQQEEQTNANAWGPAVLLPLDP